MVNIFNQLLVRLGSVLTFNLNPKFAHLVVWQQKNQAGRGEEWEYLSVMEHLQSPKIQRMSAQMQLSRTQLTTVTQSFAKVDNTGTGSLNKNMLGEVMKELGRCVCLLVGLRRVLCLCNIRAQPIETPPQRLTSSPCFRLLCFLAFVETEIAASFHCKRVLLVCF
jgi:hypothetical protein